MEIEYKIMNNILVVKLVDRNLDAKNSHIFKERVIHTISITNIYQVVLNLEQLQFIDSSGLGSLLSILRNLNEQGGEIKLAQITKPICTMFELVSMDKIFETFDSIDDAVKSF